MDCPICNLRYNTVTRTPYVHQCGHTLCQLCSHKITLCHICQVALNHSKASLNHSLMEMLKQRKSDVDIDKLIKVCFVGESKVGKTSLINRLKGHEYRENTIPTIGFDFAFADRQVQGLHIRFQLWDSAGQERYRSVSPLHYKNSDIIVIVYDMTQTAKDNNIDHWLEESNHHCPENTIKILVGNKIDLIEEMNKIHNCPIDQQTWKTLAAEKIYNYPVSCKTNEGIEQFWAILDITVKTILRRLIVKDNPFGEPKSQKIEASTSNLNKSSPSKLSKSSYSQSRLKLSNCRC